MSGEEELLRFEQKLIDRFGALPEQAVDLINSVRIKWIAKRVGLEKVVMKKNKLVGYFIANQQSDYYQSPGFNRVLQFVQTHAQQCKIKEKQTRQGLRLLLTFERVNSVNKALKVLQPLDTQLVEVS